MTMSVGVIGVGMIGKPIAECLARAGFSVALYDIRASALTGLPTRNIMVCQSCADVAGRADLVISLVRDGTETLDVVSGAHGIMESMRPGSIFAIGSTVAPSVVREISQRLAPKGCETLDMPITGGAIAAAEGKLVLMVGGQQATIDRALPAFRAFASIVTRTGDLGTGQTAKIAHQLVMSINIMALLEGLSLAAAGGVEPAIMKQIIGDGIAASGVLRLWNEFGQRWKWMFQPQQPGSAIPILRKDQHLALELARELSTPLYLGTQASLVADAGVATGHDNPAL
jgi:3-hydroxyisobutyrate dehydrogenase-like beta-hydroxyacid dehydrogenase